MIGELPFSYNYISGVSPKLEIESKPSVIHYTDGGPWFDTCRDVPYAQLWMDEYEDWSTNGSELGIGPVPTMAHEGYEVRRK